MRILVLGANGTLGRVIARTLHAAGHQVIGASRERARAFSRAPEFGWVRADFARDEGELAWRARLYAIDVIVNAALPARESAADPFESTLALGPARLYTLAASLGVARIVHLTDEGWRGIDTASRLAAARYAERALERLRIDWSVLALAAESHPDDIAAAVARLVGGGDRRRYNLDNRDDAIGLIGRATRARDDALVVLFDGGCPICYAEMTRFANRDRARRLVFRDLAAPAVDLNRYGVTRAAAMRLLHVVRPGGHVLVGMDAVHAVYRAIGLAWLSAPTRWPGLRVIADRAYALFATHRMRLSRVMGLRCNSATCALPAR